MLLSMTGHGQAQLQADGLTVAADIRTVNARYLKLSLRVPDGYTALEPLIDALIREHIRRGTVYVSLTIDHPQGFSPYRIDTSVLHQYRQQLAQWLGVDEPQVPWQPLVQLPGVVIGQVAESQDLERVWSRVEEVLCQACEQLNITRRQEGQAMARYLTSNCQAIRKELQAIRQRAPLVVDQYRSRLMDRLNKYLAELNVTAQAADVIREVGLWAERVDICEELLRLETHLDRFEHLVRESPDSPGRKLEFVIQEMVREANTMGAKANDAEIAQRVVDVKSYMERLREVVQNIE